MKKIAPHLTNASQQKGTDFGRLVVQTERRKRYVVAKLYLCWFDVIWRKRLSLHMFRMKWSWDDEKVGRWRIRCLDYNDLSKALANLHFKLNFSFFAYDSLPLIFLFCLYVSPIHRFLFPAPLALHILALTINSQQTQVRQWFAVKGIHFNLGPEKSLNKNNFVSGTFETLLNN